VSRHKQSSQISNQQRTRRKNLRRLRKRVTCQRWSDTRKKSARAVSIIQVDRSCYWRSWSWTQEAGKTGAKTSSHHDDTLWHILLIMIHCSSFVLWTDARGRGPCGSRPRSAPAAEDTGRLATSIILSWVL
jgi:hypothetical protein